MIVSNRKDAIKCKYYIYALCTMFDGKSIHVWSNKRISLIKFTSKTKKMHFGVKNESFWVFFSTFFTTLTAK